jgi:hypothetical protein
VKVYAGIDQLTGKKIWLRETVAARATQSETKHEAQKAITRQRTDYGSDACRRMDCSAMTALV